MKKNLYIVQILNYNGSSFLKDVFFESIGSIFKQTYKNYIVHLIDNCSTDTSVEDVHKNFPAVKVTRVNKNLGYVSHNFGLKYFLYAQADILLVMNNDIILEKDFLEKLDPVFNRKDVGAAMPLIKFNRKKDIINSTGLILNLTGFAKNRDYGLTDNVEIKSDSNIFLSGGCFGIKRELLKKVSLFDFSYSSFYEDADLSARILTETDYKISFVKDAVCYHEYSGSFKNFSKKKDFLILKNQYLFLLKFLSFPYLLKAKIHFLKTRFLKRNLLHIKIFVSLFLLLPKILFFRFKRKFIIKAKRIEHFLEKSYKPFQTEEIFDERVNVVSTFEQIPSLKSSITFGIDDFYIGRGFSFLDKNFPVGRYIFFEGEIFLESKEDCEYVLIYYPENQQVYIYYNGFEMVSKRSPFYFKVTKRKINIKIKTEEKVKITYIGRKDG
uniref:Glycosyltransferase family 2 protein n=1 Tax=candidate division WOR-3 bacterium TaxID=2052148 RepID=A0A7C3J6I1_UNCW3